MSLSQYEKRCQGRVVVHLGTRTLARDCSNCLRRTDAPAAVQNSPWMQPPPLAVWGTCPSHLAPAPIEPEAA